MATLSDARRLVIKVGSSLLVADGGLRDDWLGGLAEDVAEAAERGASVVLVSSGSIALGRAALNLPAGPLSLEQSQAAAAVGQIRLARAYQEALAPHGLTAAQILLTLEDSSDRRRYLNSRATLEQLLSLGVVPIVNENDTVATDEIRFGDNDRLAARIAVTVGADHLVLLSDVDGFYDGNPQDDPDARRIDVIERITPEIEAMAGDAGSGLSRGGMKTKLMAARTATDAGCTMVIADGHQRRPIRALLGGAPSTVFAARTDPRTARRRWIGAMKAKGTVTIDAGAAAALAHGKSLLPAGVVAVSGRFGRGDPVAILGPAGERLGIGLIRFTADEAAAIRGHRSHEIEGILGYAGRSSLIHRDDMSL